MARRGAREWVGRSSLQRERGNRYRGYYSYSMFPKEPFVYIYTRICNIVVKKKNAHPRNSFTQIESYVYTCALYERKRIIFFSPVNLAASNTSHSRLAVPRYILLSENRFISRTHAHTWHAHYTQKYPLGSQYVNKRHFSTKPRGRIYFPSDKSRQEKHTAEENKYIAISRDYRYILTWVESGPPGEGIADEALKSGPVYGRVSWLGALLELPDAWNKRQSIAQRLAPRYRSQTNSISPLSVAIMLADNCPGMYMSARCMVHARW